MLEINLSVKNLSHKVAHQAILSSIDFDLSGFQAVTLLGPNGAGKSTLLKALSAQLYCQRGSVDFNDNNSENNSKDYASQVGYMPEIATLLPELTVLEQLHYSAQLKAVKQAQECIDQAVETCQLQSVLNKRTTHISLGYRQRLNLAQAIINQPQLLIMDEPLNGLDPHLMIEFRNIIQQLKQKSLIIISTHYLAEAQIISDRVLILQAGQLLDNINLRKQKKAFDLEQTYLQHTSVAH